MDNKNQILNKYTYLYLCIPTILFLFGWCKFYIALIFSSILLIIFFTRYKLSKPNFVNIKKYIKENKKVIIVTLLISCVFVFISGIGGYVFQNEDHLYRNAVFDNLVYNGWPVVSAPEGNFESPIFLVYYFAFWLPAAVVGKLLGINAGYLFLYIWSVIGVYLTFSHFRKYSRKNFILPIIMFIFFSGLDIVENFLYGKNVVALITSATHIEWTTGFQFSSFTTQLFWVFNQAIPAWLLTMFILNEKDNRILGIMVAISLIFCTLPAVGLAFIVLYKVFFENFNARWFKNDKDKFKEWFKNTFTWENILVGVPLLLIFALFVKSNLAGGTIVFGVKEYQILPVIITIFFEYIIYFMLVYKYQKKSPLFYIALIPLLICPFVSINNCGDFCMRASIPSLVVLFIMILDSLNYARDNKDKKFIVILTILFVLGSVTPLNEMKRTIANTNENTKPYAINLITSKHHKNFYGYVDDSLFYKYFAK